MTKEYHALSLPWPISNTTSCVTVDVAWLRPGERPEEHLQAMVTWLEECFVPWEEDEERAFFIAPYASEQLKDFDWSDGSGFADYWPTCRGEVLDFWFERVLELDDQVSPIFLSNLIVNNWNRCREMQVTAMLEVV